MNKSNNEQAGIPDINWKRIYLIVLCFNAFLVVVFFIITRIFNHPVA